MMDMVFLCGSRARFLLSLNHDLLAELEIMYSLFSNAVQSSVVADRFIMNAKALRQGKKLQYISECIWHLSWQNLLKEKSDISLRSDV